MRDAFRVGARERRGKLTRGRNDGCDRRPAAGADLGAQRAAIDALACDEQVPVDLFERVHRADARMRQRGGRARLAPKALAMQPVARLRRQR